MLTLTHVALGCSVQMDMTMLTVLHVAKFIATVVHGNWRFSLRDKDDFKGKGYSVEYTTRGTALMCCGNGHDNIDCVAHVSQYIRCNCDCVVQLSKACVYKL